MDDIEFTAKFLPLVGQLFRIRADMIDAEGYPAVELVGHDVTMTMADLLNAQDIFINGSYGHQNTYDPAYDFYSNLTIKVVSARVVQPTTAPSSAPASEL